LDLTDQNALFTEGIRVGVRDVEIGGYGDAEMNTIGFLERGVSITPTV
jgi:glycine/serine hydroxymethyltransferase